MSWGGFFARAFGGLAAVAGGGAAGPASASASPVGDVSTAVGASISVLKQIEAQNLTIAEAESFANDVQQILVDLGIEPGIVLEASKLLEAIGPVFLGAWRSGIVTGGYPDIVAQEDDPNFKNR